VPFAPYAPEQSQPAFAWQHNVEQQKVELLLHKNSFGIFCRECRNGAVPFTFQAIAKGRIQLPFVIDNEYFHTPQHFMRVCMKDTPFRVRSQPAILSHRVIRPSESVALRSRFGSCNAH